MAKGIINLFRELRIINEIAEKWLADALAHGFPLNWERQLRTAFRILAALTILTGWTIILVSGYFAADYAYNALP